MKECKRGRGMKEYKRGRGMIECGMKEHDDERDILRSRKEHGTKKYKKVRGKK